MTIALFFGCVNGKHSGQSQWKWMEDLVLPLKAIEASFACISMNHRFK